MPRTGGRSIVNAAECRQGVPVTVAAAAMTLVELGAVAAHRPLEFASARMKETVHCSAVPYFLQALPQQIPDDMLWGMGKLLAEGNIAVGLHVESGSAAGADGAVLPGGLELLG